MSIGVTRTSFGAGTALNGILTLLGGKEWGLSPDMQLKADGVFGVNVISTFREVTCAAGGGEQPAPAQDGGGGGTGKPGDTQPGSDPPTGDSGQGDDKGVDPGGEDKGPDDSGLDPPCLGEDEIYIQGGSGTQAPTEVVTQAPPPIDAGQKPLICSTQISQSEIDYLRCFLQARYGIAPDAFTALAAGGLLPDDGPGGDPKPGGGQDPGGSQPGTGTGTGGTGQQQPGGGQAPSTGTGTGTVLTPEQRQALLTNPPEKIPTTANHCWKHAGTVAIFAAPSVELDVKITTPAVALAVKLKVSGTMISPAEDGSDLGGRIGSCPALCLYEYVSGVAVVKFKFELLVDAQSLPVLQGIGLAKGVRPPAPGATVSIRVDWPLVVYSFVHYPHLGVTSLS